MRIATSNDFETLSEVEKFRTPKDIPNLKQEILNSVQKLTQNQSIDNICVGVPGIVNQQTKTFIAFPNIPVLDNQPFSSILDFPAQNIFVKNDALLATLGEATTGAGKDYKTVAYLTLSTGVGGARIHNKTIDETYRFFEPGHQIILGHSNGQLGSYVSGTAFEQIYKVKPLDCNDQKIWNQYAINLAYGLTNVIAMWAPDVIVLGGGVSNQFDRFIKPLNQNLININEGMFEIPPIVKSFYMDKAALYGGLAYLKSALAVS